MDLGFFCPAFPAKRSSFIIPRPAGERNGTCPPWSLSQNPSASQAAAALSLLPPSKTLNYRQHLVKENPGLGDTAACSVSWRGRPGTQPGPGQVSPSFSVTSVIPHPAFTGLCELNVLDTCLSRCRRMFWPRAELLLQCPLKMSIFWTPSLSKLISVPKARIPQWVGTVCQPVFVGLSVWRRRRMFYLQVMCLGGIVPIIQRTWQTFLQFK